MVIFLLAAKAFGYNCHYQFSLKGTMRAVDPRESRSGVWRSAGSRSWCHTLQTGQLLAGKLLLERGKVGCFMGCPNGFSPKYKKERIIFIPSSCLWRRGGWESGWELHLWTKVNTGESFKSSVLLQLAHPEEMNLCFIPFNFTNRNIHWGENVIYICVSTAYHKSGKLGLPFHLLQVTLNDSKICVLVYPQLAAQPHAANSHGQAGVLPFPRKRSLKPSDPFRARSTRTNCVLTDLCRKQET